MKNVNGDVKISVPENIGVVGYVKTIFGKYKTRIALDNPLEITKNGAALIRTATNSLTLDIATNTGSIWLKDGEPARADSPTAQTATAESGEVGFAWHAECRHCSRNTESVEFCHQLLKDVQETPGRLD